MPLDFHAIGERVLAARHARYRNREQLAAAADISKNTIVAVEKAQAEADLATLDSIAKALGVSLQWLLFGSETGREPPPAFGEFLQTPIGAQAPPNLVALLRGISWPEGVAPTMYHYMAICGALMGLFDESRVREIADHNEKLGQKSNSP